MLSRFLALEIAADNPQLRLEKLFLELRPLGKFHDAPPDSTIASWSLSVKIIIDRPTYSVVIK
jgi:hypothetical protein